MGLNINPILLEPKEYPMVTLENLKSERLSRGQSVFDFGTGDPQIPLASFLKEALIEGIPDVPQYPSIRGIGELNEAICSYLKRVCGAPLQEEHVLPTAGSKEAVYHLYPLLIHPESKKKGVIYPDPGYPVYSSGARFHGATLYPQVVDEKTNYQIDLAQIPEHQLEDSSIAWVCNPHNPTGAVGDEDWLTRQLEIARHHKILLCVDECYFEIYRDKKPPTVLSHEPKGWLSFHSLSKRSGFTAFRSGFIAGDPTYISYLRKMRAHFGVASQTCIQKMAVAAWQEEAHAEKRRQIFSERRQAVIDFLEKNKFSFSGREATFYLWVRVPASKSEEDYCQILFEKSGILASPGTFFGEGGRGHFRLALVPDLEKTEEALVLWQELIDSGQLPVSV